LGIFLFVLWLLTATNADEKGCCQKRRDHDSRQIWKDQAWPLLKRMSSDLRRQHADHSCDEAKRNADPPDPVLLLSFHLYLIPNAWVHFSTEGAPSVDKVTLCSALALFRERVFALGGLALDAIFRLLARNYDAVVCDCVREVGKLRHDLDRVKNRHLFRI
jgi:hypothetical protein